MKTLVAVLALALVAIAMPAFSQSVDQPIADQRCRDFPFPFSVLCLANAASYRDMKPCAEIGQTSIKPYGQQCDAGRAQRPSISIGGREPRGRDCEHSYSEVK